MDIYISLGAIFLVGLILYTLCYDDFADFFNMK